MRFTIDQQLLEKLLNYCATKPYAEVAQIIAEAQKDVKPIKEDNDDSNRD